MKRTFMHFTNAPQLNKAPTPDVNTIDAFTKEIEDTVLKMIESGTDEGVFRLTLPKDMDPSMIPEFMDEVMRRLQDRLGD